MEKLRGTRASLMEGSAVEEDEVFVLSVLDCYSFIFLSVYFIITLSDLEYDYINA